MMQIYTVLLMYPDYASGNYGEDTYMSVQAAESVEAAQEQAQREVAEGYFGDSDEAREDAEANFIDFAVLMVIEGEHKDIKEVG